MQNKIKYFEVFVHEMYEWQNKEDNNDLSLLKLMKLLFFVTAVDSKKDSQNILIKNVFDNYVAMPFGHVESTVYDSLKSSKELNFYSIDFNSTTRKSQFDSFKYNEFLTSLESTYVDAIKKSVLLLKQINKNIITFKAFDLVELSHQWYSWRKNFKLPLGSQPISPDEIIHEDKYFNLQVF